MSISDMIAKLLGVILAVVGLALVLSAVGIHVLAVSFLSPIWSILLGLVLLAVGIWIIRGGNLSW